MKRYLFLFIYIVLIFSCSREKPQRFSGETMGTTYQVTIAESGANSETIQTLKAGTDSVLAEINRQMSTYIPTSEISKFNRFQSRQPFKISSEFMDVLRLAHQIYQESGGAFDVTIGPLVNLWGFGSKGSRNDSPADVEIEQARNRTGMHFLQILDDSTIVKNNPQIELDLSAIAKGYGVDVVSAFMKERGLSNFLVEIGGEVVVSGSKFGKKWRIGIDRPQYGAVPGQDLKAILAISEAGVATSGDYRNYFLSHDQTYSHTLNPLTGRPIVNGVASVTVIAPSCVLADAMATAIMVMGTEKGLRWANNKESVECFIIQRTNEDYLEIFSDGFEKYLSP